jgi:predicted membrane protein
MGGCEIDLRQAAMQADEVVINTFSFWGGIEIRVPEDWNVSTEILPLMGGCEDHTETHGDRPHKHLVVKGMAIMGGVEVRN